MAPRYHLDADLVGPDGLQSTAPHWVVGFARYANPITYSVTKRQSVTRDITFAYEERPVLVVDDQGDCAGWNVSSGKGGHTVQAQVMLKDSGVPYLNEVLPGDWCIVCVAYDLDAARELARRMREGEAVNMWDGGLKFLGRVTSVNKTLSVSDTGVPFSAYSISCMFGAEYDCTLLYYPQLVGSDAIPVSLELFGKQVSEMVRGNEADERGAHDINRLIPKLVQVIFGVGAWANDPKFGGHERLAENPNQAFIVPQTVLGWLGLQKTGSNTGPTFADINRVMMGVQKFTAAAKADNSTVRGSPGKLFWPDDIAVRDGAYQVTTFPLMGACPVENVPPTTTTPWAFMSNYFNQPINEPVVTLRADRNGDIFPFLIVRQTPYTTEVGAEFDPDTFRQDRASFRDDQTTSTTDGKGLRLKRAVTKPKVAPSERPPVFKRTPTTRFLELPRWVASQSLVKQASFSRSDMTRQNLVFVYGSGAGMGPNESDQFVNAKPVKDDLDIARHGIRPYMPSVNMFLRDLQTSEPTWRDLMADIVMGQHLTLSGSVTLSGIRAPIAVGDNFEFEGLVYHIEGLSHSCSVADDGRRQFVTSLSLSRGCVDRSAGNTGEEKRASSFLGENDKVTQVAVTKD